MCQGLRDVANLVWKLAAVRGGAPDALLDSYGEERGCHVRTLTTRIKAIGRQICERDPDAARARDAALPAQGGGRPPEVRRQDVVPPLETGFLAGTGHAAEGTLFPHPVARAADGWLRMDRATGGGWRVLLSPVAEDAPGAWRIGPEGCRASLIERDGVAAASFARHGAAAAILRPDHYVYGVATDGAALAALRAALSHRLHMESVPA